MLWRQEVADSVVNVPLHVRRVVTQMAIATKLYSLNESVVAIIPHCYPTLVVLGPIPVCSASYVLLVKQIKI